MHYSLVGIHTQTQKLHRTAAEWDMSHKSLVRGAQPFRDFCEVPEGVPDDQTWGLLPIAKCPSGRRGLRFSRQMS